MQKNALIGEGLKQKRLDINLKQVIDFFWFWKYILI
jgi:hypothetical protein